MLLPLWVSIVIGFSCGGQYTLNGRFVYASMAWILLDRSLLFVLLWFILYCVIVMLLC